MSNKEKLADAEIVQLANEHNDPEFGLQAFPFARAVESLVASRCRAKGGAHNNDSESDFAGQSQATKVQAVPEGWKLVPVEPTEEMKVAAVADAPLIIKEYWNSRFTGTVTSMNSEMFGAAYAAMLAAAPQAPTAPVTQQAAKAETAEQAEGEHANVLPPFAAPAGQLGAWIAAKDQLPEKYCLAVYETSRGQQRIIRAMHVKQYDIEANGDDCYTEINDANDTEYLREGWYELIDNWGDYSSVHVCEGVVTHWMPLPPTPDQMSTAGAAKGGGNKSNSSDLAPTTSTVSAPDEIYSQALEDAANLCENWYVKGTQMHHTMSEFAARFRMMKGQSGTASTKTKGGDE